MARMIKLMMNWRMTRHGEGNTAVPDESPGFGTPPLWTRENYISVLGNPFFIFQPETVSRTMLKYRNKIFPASIAVTQVEAQTLTP